MVKTLQDTPIFKIRKALSMIFPSLMKHKYLVIPKVILKIKTDATDVSTWIKKLKKVYEQAGFTMMTYTWAASDPVTMGFRGRIRNNGKFAKKETITITIELQKSYEINFEVYEIAKRNYDNPSFDYIPEPVLKKLQGDMEFVHNQIMAYLTTSDTEKTNKVEVWEDKWEFVGPRACTVVDYY